jgi:hypothetical protein
MKAPPKTPPPPRLQDDPLVVTLTEVHKIVTALRRIDALDTIGYRNGLFWSLRLSGLEKNYSTLRDIRTALGLP